MKTAKFRFVVVLFIVASLVAIVQPNSADAQDAPILFPEGDIETISLELETDSVLPPPFFIRNAQDYSADVHFPNVSAAADAFPVVAVLQGAFVDNQFYSKFGMQLARFGFVVVIPNSLQELVFDPDGPAGPIPPVTIPPVTITAPFPDQDIILDVLAQMIVEDNDQDSPLFEIVDTDRIGLAGHSLGGAAGLFAIGRICPPPFCDPFSFFPLPPEVRGGAFYGTNTIPPGETDPIPVNTGDFPVALVQGTRDSIATLDEALATIKVIAGPSELIPIIDVDGDPGANHYGITNQNNPGAVFPNFIPPTPDPNDPKNISQSESIELIANATGEFLLEALTEGQLIPGEFPVSAKKKLDVDDEVNVNGRRVAKGKTEADSIVEIDASRDTVSQFLPNLVPSVFPENSSNIKIKVEEDCSFVSDTEVFFKEIEIKKEQTASFSGGGPFHIDKLKVKKGAVLNLGAGTYFINKYEEVEEDSQLTLSGTPVVLHIGDKFKVEKKRIVLNAGGSVDGLRVYLHEDAEFKAKEVDFTGLLYGPHSKKIEVEKATVKGAIITSGEAKLKKKADITYTQTDQALVGLTVSIPE